MLVVKTVLAFFLFSVCVEGVEKDFCERKYTCDQNSLYRKIDGSCNNLNKPWIGSANSVFRRFLASSYDDLNNTIRSRSVIVGGSLPNPRVVTLKMHYPVEKDGPLNLLAVTFGQMVTHDITELGTPRKEDGSRLNCNADDKAHPDCMFIAIPPEDTLNAGQEHFKTFVTRAKAVFMNYNCKKSAREQVNTISHWLDLSVIYGSDMENNRGLRTQIDGLLKTSDLMTNSSGLAQAHRGFGALPGTLKCFVESEKHPCFKGGEARLNINMALVALQAIWVREHNRIARLLKSLNQKWTDEALFEEARRVVVAEYQHIAYNEWLPLIIGEALTAKYRLTGSFNKGYDSTVDGQIYSEFAAAAFRFGHGMVKSHAVKRDIVYQSFKNCSLKSVTFDSTEAYTNQGLDALSRGALIERSSSNDAHITDTLANHLIEHTTAQNTTIRNSLPALTIQRGRELGISGYNKFRKWCGLGAVNDFSELTNIKKDVVKRLLKTYKHVDDIDLFTGGMSETPMEGAVVGPTFACMIARQFDTLKFGDRFFYTHETVNEKSAAFKRIPSACLYQFVKDVTFAGVLSNNMPSMKIQRKAFLPQHNDNNPFIKNLILKGSSIQAADLARFSRLSCPKSHGHY